MLDIYLFLFLGIILVGANKFFAELQTEIFFYPVKLLLGERVWMIKGEKIYYVWMRIADYIAGTGAILITLYILLFE